MDNNIPIKPELDRIASDLADLMAAFPTKDRPAVVLLFAEIFKNLLSEIEVVAADCLDGEDSPCAT